MKRLVLFAAAALAACSPTIGHDDQDDVDEIVHRAQLVRSCPSGLAIGIDPVTRRLVWSQWNGAGLIAKGVTIDKVCAQ